MLYRILAVYDSVSASYSQPFFAAAVGAGVRSFTDEVNRSAADNPYFQHPGDFSLYVIGSYDPLTGQIVPCSPDLVARAADLRQ